MVVKQGELASPSGFGSGLEFAPLTEFCGDIEELLVACSTNSRQHGGVYKSSMYRTCRHVQTDPFYGPYFT